MVGLYIDALSDEQRDRIVEAEDFGHGRSWDARGRGCLVAVAELEALERTKVYLKFYVPGEASVGTQFDDLIAHFGKARIIHLCKARAARGNRLHEIRAEVYRELVPAGGMSGRFPEDCR